MAGHVFVIKGDVRNVACDAFLFATDKQLSGGGRWHDSAPDVENRLDPDVRSAFQGEHRFTLPVAPRPGFPLEPTPILTAVPFKGIQQASDIVPRIHEFFEVAVADAAQRQVTVTLAKRGRPLLAVPLFGAGGGGGGPVRGDIFRVLYAECRRAATEHDVDVVVVLRDPRDYDLAQAIRREPGDAWPELTPDLLERAMELARRAAAAELVPFTGAGISMSAGAPSWDGLIRRLAQSAGVPPETIDNLVDSHDVLDQATYLHREFDRRHPDDPLAFAAAVIEAVKADRYGLGPALLASLQAEQAITLNYDTLFETAAADAALPRRVIPGPFSDEERWLLKLHGTIDDLRSIVLTRDDYLGFNSDRAALSSLVKATLMTRHLLFVGFGVKDPHFHEIVHDVRRALPERAGPFGTVVTLTDSEVTRRLWSDDLDFVTVSSARLLDVFLDALLAHAATTHSYLLADGYASTLPDADAALRDALLRSVSDLPAGARQSKVWPHVEEVLVQLGLGAEGDGAVTPRRPRTDTAPA